MSIENITIDSENELMYFHHRHISIGLPIKTGFDSKWYIVALNSDDLIQALGQDVIDIIDSSESIEITCYGGFNNAIETRSFYKFAEGIGIPMIWKHN